MTVAGRSVHRPPPAGHGASGAVGAGFRVSGFMHRSERLWGRRESGFGAGLDMSGVQPPTTRTTLGVRGMLPRRTLCEAKYSELYLDERYDGALLGALRPLIHGVAHGCQYELPPLTERARNFENVISNQVKE